MRVCVFLIPFFDDRGDPHDPFLERLNFERERWRDCEANNGAQNYSEGYFRRHWCVLPSEFDSTSELLATQVICSDGGEQDMSDHVTPPPGY